MRGVGPRGAATALATVLVLVTSAAPAQAAKRPKTLSPKAAVALVKKLGARSAGTYYDAKRKNMVVTVTDKKSAARVRAAGGIARKVTRSGLRLAQLVSLLQNRASYPGTAWGIDTIENKVVLSVDSTVDATTRAKLREIVIKLGKGVRIEFIKDEFKPFLAGGDAVFVGAARCSVAFNVLRGGVQHFLTAGHCGNFGPTWTVPATTVASSYPTNDFAIARYTTTTPPRPGTVNLYNGTFQEINVAANPVVGQSVKKSGSTTRVTSGVVQALNQTVNYGSGTVTGLIRTNVCAEPGDSGGALFAGTVALGIVSGGSGNCTTGGTVFYQPVVEALQVYGATIY
jgi:streptogrisin D